jgi:hypothetical protein
VLQRSMVRANTSLSFYADGAYGIGKTRVNRLDIKGMEIIEKTKLARIN